MQNTNQLAISNKSNSTPKPVLARAVVTKRRSIFDDVWMTSIEIAEATGKDHKNVLRDITKLISSNKIDQLSFEPISIEDSYGRPRNAIMLDFQASMLLVTGYDVDRRKAVLGRWMALEEERARTKGSNVVIPQTLPKSLELAGKLQLKIEEDAPKVAFVDDVVSQTEGLMTLGDFGRVLNSDRLPTGAMKIFTQLRTLGIIPANTTVPYSNYVDRGYFVVTSKVTDKRVAPVTFITGKGQVWVHKQLKRLFGKL